MTMKRSGKWVGLRLASVVPGVLLVAACITISSCATTADSTQMVAAPEQPTLAEEWGVEVVALRLTGANFMLDFRYKVQDTEKAAEIFERANKPLLIHKASGARLQVPSPPKTGPLRPTNAPEVGRTYTILFSNPGVVHAGDEVTVQIGDFEADVVVE